MNSVWRSLFWKEWREQRWVLALLVAGCSIVPLVFLVIFREWWACVTGVAVVVCAGVPATAMFVGAALAAREQSQRTLGFMQALPASIKRAALAKLIAAAAIVTAPAALACLTCLLGVSWFAVKRVFFESFYAADQSHVVSPADLTTLAISALICGAGAASLMIWMAAAGVNHVDELRAGAVGLLVIAAVWGSGLLTASALNEAYRPVPPSIQRGFEIVMAGAPGGIFVATEKFDDRDWKANPWRHSWPLVLSFLVSHASLAAWYVSRFGRRAKPQAAEARISTTRAASQLLGVPRRSRSTAVAWKQFRESAPLAALGGLAISIAAPIIARTTSISSAAFIEKWQLTAISVWLMAGVFVAVVAGIGLFYDDLRPELHTFWRSRPIDIDEWFWIKLLTGLSVTVGVLAAGPLLTLAAHWATGQVGLEELPQEPPLGQVIGLGLLLHATTFVLAALAITLVRQPVFAALTTFFSGILAAMLVGSWYDDELSLGQGIWVLGAVAVVGLAAAAWQAVRRDWGWGAGS